MAIHVIELVPRANEPGMWNMCNPDCHGPGSYPDLVLPPKSGGHTIIFDINPAAEVTFKPTVQEAIWIQPGNKPTGAKIAPQGQLGTPVLINEGRTLVVNDKNTGKGVDLHYQLNFGDGTTLDPVIRNGGGGGNVEQSAAVLVGAAVAILLVGLWFGRLWARRQS